MPLLEEHRDLLDSAVADANNAPGNPGATTAALFLQPFAGDLPWAHLDVAGPARAGSDDAELVKGGTGFGARTLLRWLEAGAPTDPTDAVAATEGTFGTERPGRSLAGGAVDRLAQQVGVPGVPGGLLDQVQQHPAQVEVRARSAASRTESWSRLSAPATTSRLRAQARGSGGAARRARRRPRCGTRSPGRRPSRCRPTARPPAGRRSAPGTTSPRPGPGG